METYITGRCVFYVDSISSDCIWPILILSLCQMKVFFLLLMIALSDTIRSVIVPTRIMPMEIPFCSAFVTFLWIYAFFSVKFSDLKMRECKNKYQVCNVHCRSPLGGFFFPSTTHRLVCRHYLASPPLWALLANGWDSSDCYHHDIISNGKLKISTLEF